PHRNVYLDLSGSGVDGGMVEACLESVGAERLLWGSDITMDTGWAKLRYLHHLLPPADFELVASKNAARIFPAGSFPSDWCASTSMPSSAAIPSPRCRARRRETWWRRWIAWGSTRRG